MKLLTWTLLFLVTSCGMADRREAHMQDEIARAWQGRPVSELKAHTYLQTLKAETSQDKLTFTKEMQSNSRARCAALGVCISFFDEGCQHTFFVKQDLVTCYTGQGDCFTEMEWLLKRSPKIEKDQ